MAGRCRERGPTTTDARTGFPGGNKPGIEVQVCTGMTQGTLRRMADSIVGSRGLRTSAALGVTRGLNGSELNRSSKRPTPCK
jgi:hypothetical protein